MKSHTKPALRVVPAAPVQLSLKVEGVLRDVEHAFLGQCMNAGKQALAADDGSRPASTVQRQERAQSAAPSRARSLEHKRRNVIEYLPKDMHASVGRALCDAWDGADPALAKRNCSAWLRRFRPSTRARRPAYAKG
jgi:hypothetical protein